MGVPELSTGESIVQTVDFADHPDIPGLAFEALDDLAAEMTVQHRQQRDVKHEWTLDDEELAVSGARKLTLALPAGTFDDGGRYVIQAAVEIDGERYVWPSPPRRLKLVASVV